ncbi:MAG: amidase [Frankiales bacterium]|nr:amidase [Frankiales bacterium]
MPLPPELSSALAVAEAVRTKRVSPLEVLDACLAEVDRTNARVNAVVWRDDEAHRAAAREAGEAVVRGDDLGPFHGVPIPVKDLTPVAGWPTTYGSWGAPEGPSAQDELVVAGLRRAGFVLAGRTNTPEFGPITVAENDRYGATRNPWDLNRSPGGSSGGAAAAVAAGMFPIAHANDGGGSIRIPASCCGLVGLKPSRGRVPNSVTAWEGAAVEGAVTWTVADAAALLDAVAVPDPLSWYNAPAPARPWSQEVGADPGSLRIGVVEVAPLGMPVDPQCLQAVRDTADRLTALGHSVEVVTLDVPDTMLAAFLNMVDSGLADYPDIDWSRTEPHIRASRAKAQSVDSLVYVSSVHELQRYSRTSVARWGSEFDVLLTPTLSILPPPVGLLAEVHAQPDAPHLTVFAMALFNAFFNVSGQPAVSLPLATSTEGLPIGVQLVGGPWQEDLLVRLASQLEQAHPWADRRPVL